MISPIDVLLTPSIACFNANKKEQHRFSLILRNKNINTIEFSKSITTQSDIPASQCDIFLIHWSGWSYFHFFETKKY